MVVSLLYANFLTYLLTFILPVSLDTSIPAFLLEFRAGKLSFDVKKYFLLFKTGQQVVSQQHVSVK